MVSLDLNELKILLHFIRANGLTKSTIGCAKSLVLNGQQFNSLRPGDVYNFDLGIHWFRKGSAQHQAINWTSLDLLSIIPSVKFESIDEISFAKWQPFFSGFNVLMNSG